MMKNATIFCLVVMLLCPILLSIACADSEIWHCDKCDEDRDTAFCPVCGTKRPDSEPSVWVCPTCRKEIPAEYSFCPDDGTAKNANSVSAWPKRDLAGTPVTLKPYVSDVWHDYEADTYGRQAYLGPDKNKYPGAGSYKINTVTSATAILREGNYILVDLVYYGSKKRVAYFLVDSLQDVPVTLEIAKLKGQPARIRKATTVMTGPGDDYEILKIGEQPEKILVPEMEISVFFEYNGWIYAEFSTAIGIVRAWLPADAVV